MMSIVALSAVSPPAFTRWFQSLTVGSLNSDALPATISFIAPIPSEWSATTSQSRGRESLTLSPCDVVTSSPRANRNASSGPNVAPKARASSELDVWR